MEKVSIMWNSPETPPPMAHRVMVETAEGSHLFARRVISRDNPQQAVWIDDQTLPIRSPVVGWKEVVSMGETQA